MSRSTLKAKEAANYLGISYWLILEMAKRGDIPHFRLGGLVLFRRESLDRWMQDLEDANYKEASHEISRLSSQS